MYKFQCPKCLKEFKQSCNYNRHLGRKKPCKRMLAPNSPEQPRIALNSPEQPRVPPKNFRENTKNENTDILTDYKPIEPKLKDICKYCNVSCKSKNLHRHYRSSCELIPEIKRKYYLDKYKNNKRHINKQNQLQIIENNKIVNSHNTTNNTTNTNTNSHNTTNIQNNNNNITIKINPFGQENIDLIPKDKQFQLLNRVFKMIPDTYRALYYDAIENRNMYIPNVNRPIVKVFDGDEWDLKSFDDVSDIVSNKMQDTIQEWSEKYNKKLSQSKQTALKNFIQKCIKGEMEKQMKNELRIFLMSFSNRIKENVDKEFNKLESLTEDLCFIPECDIRT